VCLLVESVRTTGSERPRGVRGGVCARLLLLIVVAGAAAAMVWMLFLPQLATAHVAQRSRFGVAIEALAANPFAGTVLLRGVTVENPAVFGPRDFIRLDAFE